MPARKGTGDPHDLVLRVVIEDRPYLLGEPVLAHCLLVNETEEPVVIPYQYGPGPPDIIFCYIRAADGQQIERLFPVAIDSSGPSPITIPPGQQFAHIIDLRRDYALVVAGDYDVKVEYHSKGRYFEVNREAGRGVPKPAWAGRLSADIGQIEIRDPPGRDDQRVLNILLEGVTSENRGTYPRRYARLFEGLDPKAFQRVLAEHPDSYYTTYVRYYSAESFLRGGGDWRVDPKSARHALASLEAIDRDKYPRLFQELVLHRLILAHVGLESESEVLHPLVRQFREQFPHSPYELPETAREVGP